MALLRRHLGNSLAAGILLALALACAPSRARADCGDYVQVGMPLHEATHPREVKDLPAKPMPCHGPNCSRNLPTPLVPPAKSFSPRVDDGALAHGGAIPGDLDARHLVFSKVPSTTNSFSSSIYHPPR
jgi:hypothetical protein